MVGRVIVLVTAVLVAVAGVALVWLYAQRAVSEARAELEPVRVLVAAQAVPAGTPVGDALDADLLVATDRPDDAVPPGGVGASDTDVRGLVTSTDLYPGEILLRARLEDPATSDGLQIGDQELAITLPLADPNRVARFVQPGDLVAVFLTRQGGQGGQGGATATGGPGSGPAGATTQLLVPEVRVIGVGARTAPDDPVQGEQVDASLVTFSVLQADAERLILAQSLGQLYLGLLTEGEGESAVARSGGASAGSLFEATP